MYILMLNFVKLIFCNLVYVENKCTLREYLVRFSSYEKLKLSFCCRSFTPIKGISYYFFEMAYIS